MKLSTALIEDQNYLVAKLEDEHIFVFEQAARIAGYDNQTIAIWKDMVSFIRAGEKAIQCSQTLIEKFGSSENECVYPLHKVNILSPIPKPERNILCVGRNYREHVKESKQLFGKLSPVPDYPLLFTKPFNCVIASDEEVIFNKQVTQKLDYEGELVAVIGKEGKDISQDDAMDYVYGYTLINDVSARDLQKQHIQYFKGKSLDTFAPLGPWIIPASYLPDYRQFHLETRVNGEIRQSASLSDLIFDIPELISQLSAGMTLYPGDLIATGTPSGVGGGFEPPRFLQDGDVVEVSIKEIGVLKNKVKEEF